MNGYPTWIIPGVDGSPALTQSGLLTLDQLGKIVGVDVGAGAGAGAGAGSEAAARGPGAGAPAKTGKKAFGGSGGGAGLAAGEDCEDCKLSDSPGK